MKRFIYMVCLLVLPLTLSGCAGLYANVREVEDLLVVQTMGLDEDPAGVRLTLASGADAEGAPLRLEGRGPSIIAAIERVRSLTREEALFCAHIGHVLIGEAAARQGLDRTLAYICRAPELRLSVPLYVLRGGAAADAVLGVGDEQGGICDALDSVDGDLKRRGDGHLTTAADVARALAQQGSALICAVDCLPSAEKDAPQEDGAAPLTVAAAGYGVLKGGRLCAWIDRDKAVAVDLLLGRSGPCELIVTGAGGEETTLSLERGSAALQPVWAEDGTLSRLEIELRAEAAVAETSGEDGLTDAPREDALRALLEAALSERCAAVLQLSKQLEADFLGLGEQIELRDPARFRALERPFPELLRELPVRLTVSARLTHTNDVEEAP